MSTTRRDFLRYAGMAAAVVSQSSLFAAATKSSGASPLLSVGFAPALPQTSVRLSNAPHASGPGRDVRVSIRGGARAEAYRKQPGGVAVDVVYPNGRNTYFWSAARYEANIRGSVVLHDGNRFVVPGANVSYAILLVE